MDASLQPILQANNEAEREPLVERIFLDEMVPLIRKVLRQRLGFYLNHTGENSSQPDAEDLYQNILTKLIQRLNDCLAFPESKAIGNLRNLVITTTINTCNDYLRAKAPVRARLKNNLRDLFGRHQDFQLWKNERAENIAGFAVWGGREKDSNAMERVRNWQDDPSSFSVMEGATRPISTTKLVAEILRQAGGPVEFEALVTLLISLLGTRDHPPESLDQRQEDGSWQPVDPAQQDDLRLEGKAALQSLWEEIITLPANQRLTICLSLTDQNGNDLFSILMDAEAVSGARIAKDLGLSLEAWIELWREAPMENESLAARLKTSRAQINKWRFRGLQELRKRLRKEKP